VSLTTADTLKLALDPALILRAQGIAPDPWQEKFLLSPARQVLLNCCRQAGKSTTVAALALHTALFTPAATVIILSPTQRQSYELFRKVLNAYNAVGRPLEAVKETLSTLELKNGSRILCLPGKEGTTRGYSAVDLLLIDEAAKVSDDLYKAVRPMLAVSQGRIICLSTPYGQRGFFWREYTGDNPWARVCVTWQDVPRIAKEFIDTELASLGQSWVDQEYNCLFTALEGLVYPEFESCLVDFWPLPELLADSSRWVGGMDWGWNNPFAALWGVLSRDDVLHLCFERYGRHVTLTEHVRHLKTPRKEFDPRRREVLWYADPAGATEIHACRQAGLKVQRGTNDLRLGIMAVSARIRTGRLKVCRLACPALANEAQLYRYPNAQEKAAGLAAETPIDQDNHALAALRYLVAGIDRRFIGRLRGERAARGQQPATEPRDPETARSVFGARPADEDAQVERRRQQHVLANPECWS